MFPKRLETLRKSRKMTHQQIAEKLGITRQAYSNYENGKREPDLKTIEYLSALFGVSVDYLLGLTDDPRLDKDETYDYSKDPTVTPEMKELLDLFYKLSPEEQHDAIKQTRIYIAGKKALNRSSD